MNYIVIAIGGYFLIALEAVLSKFLLTGKIKSWRLYVFYVGLLALFSLVFAPFGLQWFGALTFSVSLLSGAFLFFYLMLLYQALEKHPASFVYVLSGAVSTVTLLVISTASGLERFGYLQIGGISLLLCGGVLVSIDRKKFTLTRGTGLVVLSGILLAISLALLKFAYDNQNFVSGYVYSRLGEALAVGIAFLSPGFRREVLTLLRKKGSKENAYHFSATTAAKILAGIGTLLVNIAIARGFVTVVNALIAVQYLFTFALSIILTLTLSSIFNESLQRKDLLYKSAGVALVIIGVFLVNYS
jgi:drug/metabolite transporter (DMT)-like permease